MMDGEEWQNAGDHPEDAEEFEDAPVGFEFDRGGGKGGSLYRHVPPAPMLVGKNAQQPQRLHTWLRRVKN